ncbi:hypothetical protein ABII15_28245 [Streptomyces sp. HUAS MG91]|uniref:DUF3592 domain-containing protein n=1 Tax=Streptomyces tabacisoli TaxID=3156398 RepID=A0AAU8IZD2_9ACTN
MQQMSHTENSGTVRVGRWVCVLGVAGLVVMTGSWLFAGAGPVRSASVWAGLGVLVGCVLVVAGQVRSGGGRVSRVEAYGAALASVREQRAEAEGVPAVVLGARWGWIRVTAVGVAVVTAVALAVGLGSARPERSAAASALSGADYVIEELPVTGVTNIAAAGHSSRSSTMADYRVVLPGTGAGVSATFRAYNGKGMREVGRTYQVAYAPARPDLAAVGGISVEAVEAQLAGRALSYRSSTFVAAAWAIGAALATAVGTGIASRPRGARRVDGDWVALRATVTGQIEHVETESGSKSAPSSSRYPCLALRTDTGEDVPLAVSATVRAAAVVLTGVTGWLLWNPRGRGKAAAEFVVDDGWQLPGRVPGSVAYRIAAGPRGPVPVDAGRRTRLLELGALWPRTVPMGLLAGLLVSATAAGLLLVPVNGGWRIWAALVMILAPLLGHLGAGDAERSRVAVES